MEFYIEQLKTFSPDITQIINDLLAQLNPISKKLKDGDAKEIIEGSSNRLFIARRSDNKEIVGMLTLIAYRIPVWKKGWIEDVVVDRKYRGKGIATKLINGAVENAKAEGISSLNLTSRPQREDANRLYIKVGFKKRDTNVYTIEL